MIEFKNYLGVDAEGNDVKLTLASGPVIIKDVKVLLDKHTDNFWKFPGGKMNDDESARETAIREAKEELGIDVKLESDPMVVVLERENKEYVVLLHYKATFKGEVTPGRDVTEWAWHDVNNLPKDCAENIRPVVEYFKDEV